jgi:methylenetetrahydrofolate--tRNA-(uracil-5-)-methyltransferase
MTGVEGYVESAASGLAAGINAGRAFRDLPTVVFPAESALGSLLRYIVTADEKHFQPMNVNFGLMPPLPDAPKDKKLKNQMYADRALGALDAFIAGGHHEAG